MDIDLLPTRYKRKTWYNDRLKKWTDWLYIFPLLGIIIAAAVVFPGFEVVEYLRGKNYRLYVNCTPEQRPAVLFSLKTALGLSYVEFHWLRFEKRIPGPLFYGSREAMEWLAKGLRAENVPCRVRRAFPEHDGNIQRFVYPMAHDTSVAEAYKNGHDVAMFKFIHLR